jgi:DNA ligase D-like protein (predicted ligase)
MLAKLGDPFSSPKHLFEIKWDGTRAISYVETGRRRVLNRNRNRLDEKYPELEALSGVPDGTVIDGEITVMRDGMPSFQGLLVREQARSPDRVRAAAANHPATYMVFDLLYLGGESVMDQPLTDRRALLRDIVAPIADARLAMSEGIVGDGEAYHERAVELGLEGTVAKRLDSKYLPGKRTDAWIKSKGTQTIPCVIIGYVPEGADDLRSLAIATEHEGSLVSVGRVGSGLDAVTRRKLARRLGPLRREEPVVEPHADARWGKPLADVVWVEPAVFCRVKYLERTDRGDLRAPVFVDILAG